MILSIINPSNWFEPLELRVEEVAEEGGESGGDPHIGAAVEPKAETDVLESGGALVANQPEPTNLHRNPA